MNTKYYLVSAVNYTASITITLGVVTLALGIAALRHKEFYVSHEPGCTLAIQVNSAQLRVNCEEQLGSK